MQPLLQIASELHEEPRIQAHPDAFAAGKSTMLAAIAAEFGSAETQSDQKVDIVEPEVTQPMSPVTYRNPRPLVTPTPPAPAPRPWTNALYGVFGALALAIVMAAGLLIVSADTKPGDVLYSFKRLRENTFVAFASDRNAYEQELARVRAAEIQSLLGVDSTATVLVENGTTIRGEIESVSADSVTISNVLIEVEPDLAEQVEVGETVSIPG